MQLHANPASPFVRKVRVLAIETGLEERIELISRPTNPVQPRAELTRDNPLGKIPCLITDDGAALYDSRVICEYCGACRSIRATCWSATARAWW